MIKHAAAFLAILALAGIAWIVAMAARPVPANLPAVDMSPLNRQLESARGEALHLQRLERTLVQLDQMADSAQAPTVALAVPASRPAPATIPGTNRPLRPEISLVYVSSDLQKVVIDGELYGRGDMLPGGGRLMDISQERLVLERRGQRSVLRLPKPHALGLVPGGATGGATSEKPLTTPAMPTTPVSSANPPNSR